MSDAYKGSNLLFWLNKLNIVSKESTNSGIEFDSFNRYMHVDRDIQKDLIRIIQDNHSSSHLILLAGSSGDGKSHIFSFLREKYPKLVKDYEFYRDATESDELNVEANDLLEKKLLAFSDAEIGKNTQKMIIAINGGILSNFLSKPSVKEKYSVLKKFTDESDALEEGNTKKFYSDNIFSIVNFGGYNDLEFQENKLISPYISQLFDKVFSRNDGNPFYVGYRKDKEEGRISAITINYEMMLDDHIRNNVINLLIIAKVTSGLIIPTRMILDFMYKIVVPSDEISLIQDEKIEKIPGEMLPSLIFSNVSKKSLQKALKSFDIMNSRTLQTDNIITCLFTDSLKENFKQLFYENQLESFRNALERAGRVTDVPKTAQYSYVSAILHAAWLSSDVGLQDYDNEFKMFAYYLKGYNENNLSVIGELIEFVQSAIYKWRGEKDSAYIRDITNSSIYMSYLTEIEDAYDALTRPEEGSALKTAIEIAFRVTGTDEVAKVSIDYPTFQLLFKINNGYHPNKNDSDTAVVFVKFINNLVKFAGGKNDILMGYDEDSKKYLFKKTKKLGQDHFVFERKRF